MTASQLRVAHAEGSHHHDVLANELRRCVTKAKIDRKIEHLRHRRAVALGGLKSRLRNGLTNGLGKTSIVRFDDFKSAHVRAAVAVYDEPDSNQPVTPNGSHAVWKPRGSGARTRERRWLGHVLR